MTTGAHKNIGFMCGYPTETSVTVLVASLVSTDIDVTINGVLKTVSLIAVGDDRPVADPGGSTVALYAGHETWTGLQPFTRYPVTLTQGLNTETDASVLTAPRPTDEFRLYYLSCDYHLRGGNFADGYHYITPFLDAGGKAYAIFQDDFGYVDMMNLNDSAGSQRQSTGISWSEDPLVEYDYALGYANALGLLGDTDVANIRWGRGVERLQCLRNIPVLMQWGDHEFANDLGWDDDPDNPGTPLPALGSTWYTVGKTIWDALFAPLLPPSIRLLDTTANHWGATLGCAYLATIDRITRGSGQSDDTASTQFTSILGNNQIDDLLAALNNPLPFKILGMSLGIRYLGTPLGTQDFHGWQQPLFNHQLSEYQRLFTAEGGALPSISSSPFLNGSRGVLVTFHGDTHRGYYTRNRAPAYSGNVAETFDSWCVGTINGTGNVPLLGDAVTYGATGGKWGGTEVVYTTGPTPMNEYWCLYADFSPNQLQMSVTLLNLTGAIAAHQIYWPGGRAPVRSTASFTEGERPKNFRWRGRG